MSEPERGTGPTGTVPASDDPALVAPGAGAVEQEPASTGSRAPLTGDDAVDEALRSLDAVELQDLRTQVTTFDDVHGALQDRLADAEG